MAIHIRGDIPLNWGVKIKPYIWRHINKEFRKRRRKPGFVESALIHRFQDEVPSIEEYIEKYLMDAEDRFCRLGQGREETNLEALKQEVENLQWLWNLLPLVKATFNPGQMVEELKMWESKLKSLLTSFKLRLRMATS